jgi:hypothetical protein
MGDSSHSGCVVLISKSDERTDSGFVLMTMSTRFFVAEAPPYRAVAEPPCSIRMRVGEVRSFQIDAMPFLIEENPISKHRINTGYTGLFEPDKHLKVNVEGWGNFTCRPGSLEVWIPRET